MRRKNDTPTLAAIASRTGVSSSTVSRVINNQPGISEMTRRNVYATMQKMNYSLQDQDAVSHASTTNLHIDVLICPLPEQQDPMGMRYYASVIENIRACATAEGIDMSLNIRSSQVQGPEPEQAARSDRAGILLVGAPDASLIGHIQMSGLPMVLMSNTLPDTRCDLISTDRFHESQHLCKLLLSRGVTRIGMMLPVIDQIICDGIRCCLEHHGLELRNDDIRFVPNTTLNNYVQPLYDLLDSGDWPDALIFPCVAPVDLCDQLCRHRGLVMTDLTLPVSFSDHGIADRPFPLIYYNTPEMCRLAVEWLHRKIRHPERQPCRLAVPMIYPEDLGNTTAGDALSRPHMATGPHP